MDKDLTEILSVKYTNSSNNKSINEIYYKKEQKKKIFKEYKDINIKEANEFLQKIELFLCRYFLNFEFIFFQLNQPIDYNHNLTLYYNYIIFSIYDLSLKVDELHNKIIFKKSKLLKYSSLEDFHYLIFDHYFDQELPFTNIMDELLQYLLLLLSSNVYNENLKFFMKYIHLKIKEDFIGQNSVNIFIEKLNNENQFIKAKLDKDKIIFNGEGKISCDKIEIKFKNYPKNILSSLLYELNWIWEKQYFENFQETNFFQKKDLNYLNYLLRHILSSNLFKEIFNKFNGVSNIVDYYFNDLNIDDYIKRIIFLSYKAENIGKYAITDRRMLSVLVCGFPEKKYII